MGLFGALFTGVSALTAQSQSAAVISDNIANVNTIGFKRSETTFRSLVTTESRNARFSPGTVVADRQLLASQQGGLTQTNSTTDSAISGNGFFLVRRSEDTESADDFLYTRNGSFFEDEQGVLRNSAGFVLYGWRLDADGNLPANNQRLDSTTPINLSTVGQSSSPTTRVELAINLDASQEFLNNDLFSTPETLPIDEAQGSQFTRSVTVVDSLGGTQQLNFEFRHVIGPMANATTGNVTQLALSDIVAGETDDDGVLGGVDSGDTFTISIAGAGTETFTFTSTEPTADNQIQTVQDLLDEISEFDGAGGETGGFLEARLSNGQIIIQAVSPTDAIVFGEGSGTPLSGTNSLALIEDSEGVVEYSRISGLSSSDTLTSLSGIQTGESITVSVDGSGVDTFTVSAGNTVSDLISSLNSASGISAFLTEEGRIGIQKDDPDSSLSFSGDAQTFISGSDTLTFVSTSSGSDFIFEPEAPIVTPEGNAFVGDSLYDSNDPYPDQDDFPELANTASPYTQGWWEVRITDTVGAQLSRGLINFNADGTLNADANTDGNTVINLQNVDWGEGDLQDIEIDIEQFTQFTGAFNVVFSDQNGAELGQRTGVEVDRDGFVIARFSNGNTNPIFRLPIVTFANPNGLDPVSGTAFSETEDSGEENLNVAGTGGAGFVEPSALEQSNVDLADEFSRLIVTQRAYTAGTRVINTIDQMTEDLLRLR